ncbi:hypothetical protein N0V82_000924 [Gnomoniopsis sp. IMI 355080]|nr:hypothetical protein N0V82_000924 [Gnomoniopsis sp. IMI 355080]
MTRIGTLTALLVCVGAQVSAVTFAVPAKVGAAGHIYATLAPAPVGVSFEFFAFPGYFTNLSTPTNQCLSNWQALTGTWPPIRIGGTTQDRAQYDPTTPDYVVYTVASAADAPDSLTFGSSFMTLAGEYDGSVVLGLNRGKNNISNTIAAAKVGVSEMSNLLAIELGNEPEYWASAGQPITSGITWNPAADAASQNNWDIQVGSALGKTNIIQAGNSNSAPPTWGAQELIATENATVKQYVATYAHHNYPGGTVQSLMSHSGIVSNLNQFDSDIAAATGVGKPYVLGETNSVSGGGAATVSPTFGAALWTMDYSVRAAFNNITRTYYHQGTIGNCQYCFWGRYDMGAPYYGATAAVAFLSNGAHLTALDDGSTNYGGYTTFDSSGQPLRALLYNSDYFNGTGTRSSTSFVLTGLTASSVRAKRLTAASALSRQDQGGNPSWGGQYYTNATCVVGGTEVYETATVSGGQATFSLYASEALVVDLQ